MPIQHTRYLVGDYVRAATGSTVGRVSLVIAASVREPAHSSLYNVDFTWGGKLFTATNLYEYELIPATKRQRGRSHDHV